jgi:hypothetical protein
MESQAKVDCKLATCLSAAGHAKGINEILTKDCVSPLFRMFRFRNYSKFSKLDLKWLHLKLWNEVTLVAFEAFIVVIMKGSVS